MGMPGGTELIIIFVTFAILFMIPMVLHYRQERIILEHGTLNTIKEVPFFIIKFILKIYLRRDINLLTKDQKLY